MPLKPQRVDPLRIRHGMLKARRERELVIQNARRMFPHKIPTLRDEQITSATARGEYQFRKQELGRVLLLQCELADRLPLTGQQKKALKGAWGHQCALGAISRTCDLGLPIRGETLTQASKKTCQVIPLIQQMAANRPEDHWQQLAEALRHTRERLQQTRWPKSAVYKDLDFRLNLDLMAMVSNLYEEYLWGENQKLAEQFSKLTLDTYQHGVNAERKKHV